MTQSSTLVSSEPIDAMIIGSGFGGAVAALRLAKAGVHTVLLERGRRWPIQSGASTFSSLKNPDGRSAWLSDVALLGEPKRIDRYLGVLELVPGNGIAAFMGAGYGGGSLVYAGALYQPSQALFRKAFGAHVNYEQMAERYFPRVRSMIHPSPVPHHILQTPAYAAARAWMDLGHRAGLPTKLLDLAIDWHVVEAELSGAAPASVSAGEFWYGNNSGAKLSLDRNYLARAEETGRLQVCVQTEVVAIEEGPEHRYIVSAQELADDGTVRAQRKYIAKKLFIAAGANGTSELLVRAKAKGSLPRLNAEVGKHWGNNGDFFSAISGLAQDVVPNLGGTAPVSIEDHANAIAPTAVECFADWTTEGQQGSVTSIGLSTPPAKGSFSYDAASDRVVLTWPATDPEIARIAEAGAATYERIAAGHGKCEAVRHHAYGVLANSKVMARHRGRLIGDATPNPVSSAVTAHGLGGAVLGAATDDIGALLNYRHLYVIDGALVPGHTGCTNPALTIAALAERNIERILERDF